MSRIPDHRPAARALEESFRQLGEERALTDAPPERERQRRRRPRGTTRVLVIAITALMLAAVAATGTKVFLADGGSVPDEKQVPTQLRQAPAYRQLAQARAKDPSERVPWGVRVYTGASGQSCIIPGRVVGNRLGDVRNGRFTEIPSGAPAICASLDREHVLVLARRYSALAVAGGRSAVFGIVDRTVTRLRIVSAQGDSAAVPIAADGTFIVIRKGLRAFHSAQVVVDGSTGHTVKLLGN
jgi:hypothetical protein